MPDKFIPNHVTLVSLSNAITEFQGKFLPKVSKLQLAKRGDYVRILLKFQEYPQGSGNTFEFLTAQIANVSPQGLLKIRIMSHAQFSGAHTLMYGDDVIIQPAYVLEHDPVSAEVVKANEHTLSDMPTIAPQPGKRYWTRNGSEAEVWTQFQDASGQYWIGQAAGLRDVQWYADGRNRQGQRDLDIVKDPSVSDATLYEDVKA